MGVKENTYFDLENENLVTFHFYTKSNSWKKSQKFVFFSIQRNLEIYSLKLIWPNNGLSALVVSVKIIYSKFRCADWLGKLGESLRPALIGQAGLALRRKVKNEFRFFIFLFSLQIATWTPRAPLKNPFKIEKINP